MSEQGQIVQTFVKFFLYRIKSKEQTPCHSDQDLQGINGFRLQTFSTESSPQYLPYSLD